MSVHLWYQHNNLLLYVLSSNSIPKDKQDNRRFPNLSVHMLLMFANKACIIMIAVYIDSLVISIERSKTAQKMHWMSETN